MPVIRVCRELAILPWGHSDPHDQGSSGKLSAFGGSKMTDKTDRELLELAARAAGLYVVMTQPFIGLQIRDGNLWRPLDDDGDALRLAVKLGFTVEPGKCWHSPYGPAFGEDVLCGEMKATRRAIVRAAASIGEQMK